VRLTEAIMTERCARRVLNESELPGVQVQPVPIREARYNSRQGLLSTPAAGMFVVILDRRTCRR
jgi:hypothetical protein